ncbi:DNA breaking-rejoining enzyme [Lentinula guzmanii]|uniref:DNA breaking-rejoining enzyme n=1 Tax=Lentinula guzmanii TaxID=2804957 RepID=A0AA38MXS5_9AGAR|nr:DNA breaking-rejoining enzyme [Lentinula guzmanii]
MTFNISTDKAYTGLLKAITEDQQVNAADILDNLEENQDNIDLDLNHNQSSFDLLGLKEAVKEVSKGVSEKTSQECDSINLDGSPINTNVEQSTYTHGQKMRAAATFGFGRIHSLGMQAWHQSEISGQMLGNPSVSETVSSYMLSLRRRKTHAGETSTSARAVTSELLAELHHFNNQPEFQESHVHWSSSRKAPKGQLGPRARTMLNLGYNLAFCGLLRVDELLKIQMQDVTISDIAKTGKTKLILRLPFRKTSQFGDIKPFVWYEMPEQYQHICVVRAFARWILISELKEGYLFRKIRANDRLAEENEPMTSEQFLEMFRNNLLDIGVDFVPYGTHSFRRGGCQWLSVERRWPLRQICEWGGWSQEFTHLTIVKYLISWNDNPHVDRDDFFNMHRAPAVVCPVCNRSCHCA